MFEWLDRHNKWIRFGRYSNSGTWRWSSHLQWQPQQEHIDHTQCPDATSEYPSKLRVIFDQIYCAIAAVVKEVVLIAEISNNYEPYTYTQSHSTNFSVKIAIYALIEADSSPTPVECEKCCSLWIANCKNSKMIFISCFATTKIKVETRSSRNGASN